MKGLIQTCAHINYLFVFHPANKGKIYYGLLKEPDINIQIDEDDEGGEGEDKPKVLYTCSHHSYIII